MDQSASSKKSKPSNGQLEELQSAHKNEQNAALAAQLNGAVAALDSMPEWPWVPLVLTVIAAATRYWRLDRPPAVVFDEHHFGRFTNQYWRGEYFFDIHPPLGKCYLLASSAY
jgi:dolichyl-phosphate-mannose--protein O-mannosyl transferase